MKRVTDTSRDVFAALQHNLPRMEALVLDGLHRYRRTYASDPTSYELLEFLRIEYAQFDVNSVRPKLCRLEEAGRIEKGDKRACAVTHKRVYTWVVVSPTRAEQSAVNPSAEALAAPVPAKQTELFR